MNIHILIWFNFLFAAFIQNGAAAVCVCVRVYICIPFYCLNATIISHFHCLHSSRFPFIFASILGGLLSIHSVVCLLPFWIVFGLKLLPFIWCWHWGNCSIKIKMRKKLELEFFFQRGSWFEQKQLVKSSVNFAIKCEPLVIWRGCEDWSLIGHKLFNIIGAFQHFTNWLGHWISDQILIDWYLKWSHHFIWNFNNLIADKNFICCSWAFRMKRFIHEQHLANKSK